jgi:hypothetical protein
MPSHRLCIQAQRPDGFRHLQAGIIHSLREIHMGAWSHESFGNDDACDWAAQLDASGDIGFVE